MLKNRLEEAKGRNKGLAYKKIEMNSQRNKKEKSLEDIRETVKTPIICIMRIPGGKREKGPE